MTKKIKYQGGLTKLITSKIAKKNKIKFAKYVEHNLGVLRHKLQSESIQIDLVSFSSSSDLYDQILSILSFLRYVGTPTSWTIYSDGSHTSQQIQLLNKNFEFINVIQVDWGHYSESDLWEKKLSPYKEYLLDYAYKHPLGRRLILYLNHKVIKPTLFLDSDILFYNQASLLKIVLGEKRNGWYLPEADWGCLDSRYKKNNPTEVYQVNGGFLLFNKSLINIYDGLEFLKTLKFKYEYFTEQTIIHIILNSNGFMPLDPRKFILNTADQFDFSYTYSKEQMAIRHYTGPVRHKMWQKDWKWQLSLS